VRIRELRTKTTQPLHLTIRTLCCCCSPSWYCCCCYATRKQRQTSRSERANCKPKTTTATTTITLMSAMAATSVITHVLLTFLGQKLKYYVCRAVLLLLFSLIFFFPFLFLLLFSCSSICICGLTVNILCYLNFFFFTSPSRCLPHSDRLKLHPAKANKSVFPSFITHKITTHTHTHTLADFLWGDTKQQQQ